jgi:ABC-type uncharacterized transport system ATPase subunit
MPVICVDIEAESVNDNTLFAKQSSMHWRGKAASQAANNALHQHPAERGLPRQSTTKKHLQLQNLLPLRSTR